MPGQYFDQTMVTFFHIVSDLLFGEHGITEALLLEPTCVVCLLVLLKLAPFVSCILECKYWLHTPLFPMPYQTTQLMPLCYKESDTYTWLAFHQNWFSSGFTDRIPPAVQENSLCCNIEQMHVRCKVTKQELLLLHLLIAIEQSYVG
jgi:hypothetical protein